MTDSVLPRILRIRDSLRSYPLPIIPLSWKEKNRWSQVTAVMPWLFQAFRWWRLRKEMWAQKTSGGRVGGESKGTSSLSSSLFLSSSFSFPLSYFVLHSSTSTPGTGYILQRIYLSHSVLLSTSTSPLCRLNGVESRLCFGCTREVGKHERRVRFVREVSVYFEGKYQTSICNLYNLVLTYCAPVLKSAIIFIGKFKR